MAAGTLIIDNLESSTGAVNRDTADLINGACTAWVNFNGTGTVAIRDSFNVSSITDHAVGDYTVNFANAMSNTNWTVVVTSGSVITADSTATRGRSTTTTPVRIYNSSFGLADNAWNSVAIFGGQ